MNNDELLQELTRRIESGDLSRNNALAALNLPEADRSVRVNVASRLSAVLYFVGGGVVFFGLAFLIAQQWDDFGSFMRIFVTLGSGLAAFVVGVLLTQEKQLGAAGPAFFLLSALLIPTGLFVTYDEAGASIEMLALQVQIAGILLAAYLTSYFLIRLNVLLVFAVLFGTWLFYAFTNYMVRGAPTLDEWDFINYRILLSGLSYMLLGYSFADTERAPLTPWLYAFGVMGFLGAGLALGEWKPNQNVFWEAIYPGLVFGIIFLSTHLKSKVMLIIGSLALGGYLVKITAEYFSDSLGWAFSLVILGFLLMGTAYIAVRVNRRYVSA